MQTIPDEWWTSGLCSSFAAALKKRFGGELWAIVNHSRTYPKDDNLWHCYCVIDGIAYDADGGHTIEEASDTSQEKYPIPEMDQEHDVVMMWRKVSERWLRRVHDDYNPDDFPQAYLFLDRHRERFAALTCKVQKTV